MKMINESLVRFQAYLDPTEGNLGIQAYWCNVVTLSGHDPIVEAPRELINTSYDSLQEADSKALAFPGFSELAQQFETQPFTAVCALLEALKVHQSQGES